MDDIRTQLWRYLDSIWLRRWMVLGIAAFVSVAGWVGVSHLPARYTANAKIYVDTDTLLQPLMQGLAVQANMDQQVNLMYRTLLTRPNLEKVARATDLDLAVSDERGRERLINDLRSAITIVPEPVRNLFTIAYTGPNPPQAQKVVQALLSVFIESNLGDKRRDMANAQTFIDQRIADYETKLRAAEQRLATFKEAHAADLPSGVEFATLLGQRRNDLDAAQRELDNEKIQAENLRHQLAITPPTLQLDTGMAGAASPEAGLSPEAVDLRQRLMTLQRLRDEMALKYTPQHPDLIAANRQLAQLKQEYAAARAKPWHGAGGGGRPQASMPNAIYETLKIRLVDSEGRINALEQRVVTARAALAQAEDRAQVVPQVEAELSNLNRDYSVVRKEYDEMLARRESARLAQAMEDRRDSLQFRVVEPVVLPTVPSGPGHVIYYAAVLVAALAAGIGAAVLLESFDDRFKSAAELGQAFEQPVLGSISTLMTARERRRRRAGAVSFGAACGLLLIGLGAAAASSASIAASLPLPPSILAQLRGS